MNQDSTYCTVQQSLHSIWAGPTIEKAIAADAERNALHVIIADPTVGYGSVEDSGLILPLAERTYGEQDKNKWVRPFEKIALAKLKVSLRTGLSSRDVGENAPYLFIDGDTKFPGSVVFDGLTVAASGLQWVYDEACCHVVVAFMWAVMRQQREADLTDKDTIYFA